MDYGKFFSKDTEAFVGSPTREIFKKVDINSIYSLSGGYPSPDALPVESMGIWPEGIPVRWYTGSHGTKGGDFGPFRGASRKDSDNDFLAAGH